MKRNASSTTKMVLQSEMFPGGYKQQSYSQDGYSSSGYGQGPMHMGPTPSFSSSQMMHSGTHGHGHGQHHHSTTDFQSSASNGHMSGPFTHGNSFSHGMPAGGYGSSYTSNFSHGMPTGSYGTSYHGATVGPMGSKIESLKHDYNNYGHSSMMHSPMHGGHQSAEWKLKSIEDDD